MELPTAIPKTFETILDALPIPDWMKRMILSKGLLAGGAAALVAALSGCATNGGSAANAPAIPATPVFPIAATVTPAVVNPDILTTQTPEPIIPCAGLLVPLKTFDQNGLEKYNCTNIYQSEADRRLVFVGNAFVPVLQDIVTDPAPYLITIKVNGTDGLDTSGTFTTREITGENGNTEVAVEFMEFTIGLQGMWLDLINNLYTKYGYTTVDNSRPSVDLANRCGVTPEELANMTFREVEVLLANSIVIEEVAEPGAILDAINQSGLYVPGSDLNAIALSILGEGATLATNESALATLGDQLSLPIIRDYIQKIRSGEVQAMVQEVQGSDYDALIDLWRNYVGAILLTQAGATELTPEMNDRIEDELDVLRQILQSEGLAPTSGFMDPFGRYSTYPVQRASTQQGY